MRQENDKNFQAHSRPDFQAHETKIWDVLTILIRRKTLIINLPGSLKGAGQGLDVLLPAIPHALAKLKGHLYVVKLENKDLYKGIDQAKLKMKELLIKEKNKIIDKKRKSIA